MGYYTRYNVEVKPNDKISESLFNEIYSYKFDRNHPRGGFTISDINNHDSIKWYNHEEDMKAISLCFKDVLFIVSGIGEETYSLKKNDIWVKYFYNGKMQNASVRIVVSDFDKDKL